MARTRDPFDIAGAVVACLLALAVGGFVGAVTTFVHRQWQLPLGGVPVPLGLVAGLAVIAAVLAGFRLAFGSRIVALAAAIGVLGAAGLLALPGAGGSVVVLDDPLGWTWAIAPGVVALGVLVVPRRRARERSGSPASAV